MGEVANLVAQQRRSSISVHERASERGTLAAVVRSRRGVLGLRQAEVADLAGCSTRLVHELENGKPTLQLDKVLDILDTLGLHLEVTDGAASSVEASGALRAEFGLDEDRPR